MLKFCRNDQRNEKTKNEQKEHFCCGIWSNSENTQFNLIIWTTLSSWQTLCKFLFISQESVYCYAWETISTKFCNWSLSKLSCLSKDIALFFFQFLRSIVDIWLEHVYLKNRVMLLTLAIQKTQRKNSMFVEKRYIKAKIVWIVQTKKLQTNKSKKITLQIYAFWFLFSTWAQKKLIAFSGIEKYESFQWRGSEAFHFMWKKINLNTNKKFKKKNDYKSKNLVWLCLTVYNYVQNFWFIMKIANRKCLSENKSGLCNCTQPLEVWNQPLIFGKIISRNKMGFVFILDSKEKRTWISPNQFVLWVRTQLQIEAVATINRVLFKKAIINLMSQRQRRNLAHIRFSIQFHLKVTPNSLI